MIILNQHATDPQWKAPTPAEDTPERFAKLTGHLRVNGKPLISRLFDREKEEQ